MLRGQDAHVVVPEKPEALGEYFTKASYDGADFAAFEMTNGSGKKSRGASRTPWQVLDGFRLGGDVDDLDVWNEYELATKGKRALTTSRGLRDRLGVVPEISDEDVADAEIGNDDDTLFYVTDWSPVIAAPGLGAGILNAVAAGGLAMGLAFCREHGIATVGIGEK